MKKKTKMKNRYNLLITLIILALILNSCLKSLLCVRGDGIVTEETRRVTSFTSIENSSSFDVIYKRSDTLGIRIIAEQNIMNYIETNVYKGNLEINVSPGSICLDYNERPLIQVSSPDLSGIYNSGSGTIIADTLSGSGIVIRVSGSGDVKAELATADELEVRLSGSGDLSINEISCFSSDILISGSGDFSAGGDCEDSHLKITGSGNIFCSDLLSNTVSAISSGSGNMFISVSEYLNGLLSGSGNVYVKGDPEIDQTTTGSGRIIKHK